MADNTSDNEDGTNFAVDLPLGEEDHEKFKAIINERIILESARILRSLGDLDLEVEQELHEAADEQKKTIRRRVSVKEYFSSGLKKIFKTVDVLLGWLEQSAKKAKEAQDKGNDTTDGQNKVDGPTQQYPAYYQKKESVLRGLYHVTALGSHTYLVGLLELACEFLDLPENPYHAEREHVKICLQEVEERTQKLSELVEKACNILEQITKGKEPQFNHAKAHEFDSIVGQANVIIQSCKGLLSIAEETIDELMNNMSIVKNFSRFLRLTGCVITCYGLYHMTPTSSSVDSLANYIPPSGLSLLKKAVFSSRLNYVSLAGACVASGYAWMTLYPSRAYAFRDDLTALKLKHRRLTLRLHSLEARLKIVVNDMDKVKKSKMWSHREDSV